MRNRSSVKRSRPGRPPFFEDASRMQVLIDQYFEECDREGLSYTVPGLCAAIGLNSRQALHEYQKKRLFFDTIKRAKLKIEGQRARQLVSEKGNVQGLIFDLKNNFGWKEEM